MTYTLRVSARTLETSSITGIETPVQLHLAGKPATFVMQHGNLIVKISGFATEAEAEAFLPRIHAGLWNITLVQNLPFVLEQGRGDITYANDPVEAGKNLARGFDLEDDAPVHGLGSAGGYAIFRADQNIKFFACGEASLHTASAFATLAPLLEEAVTECDERVLTDTKIATAISLYLGQFLETSMRARLLTLMMVLEVLAPDLPKHEAAVAMLQKMMLDIKKRLLEDIDEEERVALESLQREFDFRKETSIRRRVRELVRTGVGLAHVDRSQLARDVVRAYDLRGTIVHTGVASDDDVNTAHDTIFHTVKALLRGRLGLQQ